MTKKLFALLMVFVMVFSLAACGSSEDGSSAEKTTLTIADDEWYGTDLYQQDTWSTVQTLIADTIFSIDPETGELADGICTDLEISDDGLTMTMNLPEGKYYATGEQVEPEDVKASIEYGQEISPYADGYTNIESIDIDGRQITFHLSSFSSAMLYYLGECFMGVIDKDQLDSLTPDELMWQAVPYGPYYVDSYEPASYVNLKPNEGYVCDVPLVENKGVMPIEEIYVKFNTDPFTVIEELKSGDVDYWSGVTMDAMDQLADADNVTVTAKQYPNVAFMELNTSEGSIFADDRVRQALCLAIDRDAAAALTNGTTVAEYSMICQGMLYFNQEAEDVFKSEYSNDIDKAKELLAEAGWEDTDGDGYLDKDGEIFEFTMYASDDNRRQLIVQAMQEQLKAIGIKMDSEAIDWNYVHEYLRSDDYEAGIHGLEWMDPILILNSCFDDPDAPNNTDEYYAKVADAAATVDDNERSEKLGEIQMEDLYPEWNMIPLYGDVTYIAYNSDLKGINVLSNGFLYWNDLSW